MPQAQRLRHSLFSGIILRIALEIPQMQIAVFQQPMKISSPFPPGFAQTAPGVNLLAAAGRQIDAFFISEKSKAVLSRDGKISSHRGALYRTQKFN